MKAARRFLWFYPLFIVYFIFLSSFTNPTLASSNSLSSYQKILLVVAMDKEARPIIKTLGLKKSSRQFGDLPMQGYTGIYANKDIYLILNGTDPAYHVQNVGSQAATLTTYLGIERFHPDLIISIGTAGGVKDNGSVPHEIYLSKKIYFIDRRIPDKNYHEYGLGDYKSVNVSELALKNHLKFGTVCSSDSFDYNPMDAAQSKLLDCKAIDMEAAGVAWVSMLTHTPMFAIKGITNFAQDKNGYQDYEANLPKVTEALALTLKKLLPDI